MLPTLYDWSVEHIKNVFEAKSEDECLRAIHATFSQNIDFSTNGKQLCQLDLQRFILSMVSGSGFRLKVQWQNALEVPRDDTNRDGVLGGYYIINNVRKTSTTGAPTPGRFARHKFVNVVYVDTQVSQRDFKLMC
ncbi:hypothetical protein PHLCEN_2v1395 [Hermanssonia centrifuga]|uniref:Uncharacterized protein n=1 Tax=Hermanssonia centrifuga TaxID=98765 RepID=A0A2R6S3A7_9APHY|nr:hypothetical protein PHLCEN_2v1395 [Hermanssonia centrifuga]